MPITRNLTDAIIRQQQQLLGMVNLRSQQRGRTVLGGSSGSSGGSGGPPGGFVGKLIQSQICYDTTEAETLAGSSSLVDNLNHVRYRLKTLEDIGSPGDPHENAHTACGVDAIDSPLHPNALSAGSIIEGEIEYDAGGRINAITQHICNSNYHKRNFLYAGNILAAVVEEYPVGTTIATWMYIYDTNNNIIGVTKEV